MSEEAKSLKDVTAKIDTEKLTKEIDNVGDITGTNFKKIRASHSGILYTFRPASLADMPAVAKKIQEVQDFLVDSKAGSDTEALTKDDGKLLNMMAEVICMGIGGDMTVDKVKSEFTIGDFPRCLEATLDLNDFLSGMRNIFQKRMRAA